MAKAGCCFTLFKNGLKPGDLRRMLQNNFEVSEIKAGDIMTKNPKTILLDDFAVKAVEVMRTFNITQLVVKDNSSLVGFVHIHDLMKEGIV